MIAVIYTAALASIAFARTNALVKGRPLKIPKSEGEWSWPNPEGFLKKVKEEIKVFGDEINEIAKAVNSRGFVKDEEIHRIIELEKCLLEVLREVDIVRSSDYNDSIN